MPKFPRRETDVLALADNIISGLKSNPAVFPSANPAVLEKLRTVYQEAKVEQSKALTRAQNATDVKYAKLDGLTAAMRKEIEGAQIDTSGNPGQLGLLGWGDAVAAHPTGPPGAPRALECTKQGPSAVYLDWKVPARGSGGPVRTYVVERNDGPGGGWEEVEVIVDSEIMLTDQPRGAKVEYRVIAANPRGQSAPCDPVSIVL